MATESVYPYAQSTTYVKATTQESTDYHPHYATDPSLSLTGTSNSTSWETSSGGDTDQKFNIDFGEAKTVVSAVIENYHVFGGQTTIGVDNVLIYGTNEATAFDNTTYATTTDLELLATIEVAIHAASDAADPQTFPITASTGYRYIVLRIADNHADSNRMGIRDIYFTAYVDVDVKLAGGLSFGGSMDIGGSGVEMNGGLGFDGTVAMTAATLTMNGGLGFDGSMYLDGELPIVLNSGVGFGGTISVARQTDIQLNSGLGFGGVITVDNSGNIQLSGSLRFGGVLTLTSLQELQMNGGLGFDGTVRLSGPGETGYAECELPSFDSNRWS